MEGTRRRPDARALLHCAGIFSHDIVIEIDESSHWFYVCADERHKEQETHLYINGLTKPLVWVRFNPDAYDDPATGQRVTSCFGRESATGVRVKDSKQAEWSQRLEKLRQVVAEYMVDHTDAWDSWAAELRPAPDTFLPIELFYDDVLEHKGEAAAAFEAIRAASMKRKAEAARMSRKGGKKKACV